MKRSSKIDVYDVHSKMWGCLKCIRTCVYVYSSKSICKYTRAQTRTSMTNKHDVRNSTICMRAQLFRIAFRRWTDIINVITQRRYQRSNSIKPSARPISGIHSGKYACNGATTGSNVARISASFNMKPPRDLFDEMTVLSIYIFKAQFIEIFWLSMIIALIWN